MVLKFGGTSVADAAALRRLAGLVRHAQRTTRPIVVVSALAGVTDALLAGGARPFAGPSPDPGVGRLHRGDARGRDHYAGQGWLRLQRSPGGRGRRRPRNPDLDRRQRRAHGRPTSRTGGADDPQPLVRRSRRARLFWGQGPAPQDDPTSHGARYPRAHLQLARTR